MYGRAKRTGEAIDVSGFDHVNVVNPIQAAVRNPTLRGTAPTDAGSIAGRTEEVGAVESLIIAALIYVATKIGEEVSDMISKAAANGLQSLGNAVFDRLRRDPEANGAIGGLRANPKDPRNREIVQLRIEYLRSKDTEFDNRITHLENELRTLSETIETAVVVVLSAADSTGPIQTPRTVDGQRQDSNNVEWPTIVGTGRLGEYLETLKGISDDLPL